ncbi:DUF1450 domain-containing protein [Clostridiaceae bacterium 35-E11]
MKNIKVCENNYGYGTNDVLDKIKAENPNIQIDTATCWGYCDDCAIGPYIFLNDEMIQADTPEELYEKINEAL